MSKGLRFLAIALLVLVACGDDDTSGTAGSGGASGSSAANGGSGGGTSSGANTLSSIQQTLFTPSCAVSECHDATTHMSDLNLSSTSTSCAQLVDVAATESGQTGPECKQGGARNASMKRVVANDTAHSFLYLKLTSTAECVTISGTQAGERMPKDRGTASASAIAAVKAWIEGGASCD